VLKEGLDILLFPASDSGAGVQRPSSHDDGGDTIDLALVVRIKAGQSAAWSELIGRYQDRLFAVCVRMVHNRDLATDLTQDAFVKAIQGIESFDGRSKFSTWMIRVTMNVCLSKLRSEKLRRHASLDAARGGGAGGADAGGEGGGSWKDSLPTESGLSGTREPDGGGGVEARAGIAEERAVVMEAFRLLDAEQRAVLILCDCRGLAYEQIAQVMGVAVGTVKSRVFRARTALRDITEQLLRERMALAKGPARSSAKDTDTSLKG
jgi:RNA polymerase sigma-70 factor, ECF subfamily